MMDDNLIFQPLRSQSEIISSWNGDPDEPLVSIICKTYNHEKYIEHALRGFLIQETSFPFEVIVHDDASTDDTANIIEQFQLQYPSIIKPVIQKENLHSRGLRPGLLNIAKGEFIARCEGDDYWLSKDKLQQQVYALSKYKDANLCVHPAILENAKTGIRKEWFLHGRVERVIPIEEVIERHNQFAPTASYLLRRETNEEMSKWWNDGTPKPPVGDCFTEAFAGRKGVVYLPNIWSVYRRNVPGSYTCRFRDTHGSELSSQLHRIILWTDRLRTFPEIPSLAIDHRIWLVKLNYLVQSVLVGDRVEFLRIFGDFNYKHERFAWLCFWMISKSKTAFILGRFSMKTLMRFRSG